MVDLPDGTADTITAAINRITDDHEELADAKMVGFGSDGAQVMTGCHSGVATQLKRKGLTCCLCIVPLID